MFSHTKVNQGLGRTVAESYTISDPYFSRNTVLLETNQSTTTTFSDSSANGLVFAPIADAVGTSYSPYEVNWSAYFDGTGDYLTLANNANYAPGTGDFTLEFWVSVQGIPGANGYNLLDMRPASTNGLYLNVYLASNRTIRFWSNAAERINHGTVLHYHRLYHVALIRSSGVIRLFLDGVQGGASYTDSGNYLSTSGFIIGGGYLQTATPGATVTNLFIGSISNIRYTKDQALSTSTTRFYPPSQPVTTSSVGWTGSAVAASITGSVNLLTLHTNRLIDASSIAGTVTKQGDVRVETYGPFAEPSNTYGSAHFDGTGDYLQATIANVSSFYTDLGDFTFEAWVYPHSFNGPQYSCPIFSFGNDDLMLRAAPSAATTTTLNIYGIDSVNGAAFGGSGTSSSATIKLFEWSHVVFTRESGVLNVWLNGTRIINTSTYAATQLRQTATFIRIGGANAGTNPVWNGYIADVRFVGGSAVYTGATINVPTQPLTAISGTQLLTCQSNISPVNLPVDASSTQPIIKAGNSTLSSFSPYDNIDSQTSLYFGGVGNHLVTNAAALASSTTTFTIEAWIYPTAAPTTANAGLVGDMTPTAATNWLSFGPTSSNLLQLYWVDSVTKTAVGNTFIPLNKWTHIAASVNANSIQLYVNGIMQSITGTQVLTNRGGTTNTVAMGQWNGSNVFTGYVANLSILSGTSKYNANFTPSLQPILQNTTNQTFLIGGYRQGTTQAYKQIYKHEIVDLNLATTPKTVTPTGANLFTSNFTPINSVTRTRNTELQGGSIYFDGTGDNIRTLATRNFYAPASFSISFWFYVNNLSTQQSLLGNYTASAVTDWLVLLTTAGVLNVYLDSGSTIRLATTGIQAKKWYHVCIFRESIGGIYGDTVRGIINGIDFITTSSYATAAAIGTTTKAVYVGSRAAGTEPLNGYIADLRIIEGASAHNDSPPARTHRNLLPYPPNTTIGRTVLLLNGLQIGAYDVTQQNTLELVGAPIVTTKQKRVGQTSLYFNGTTTYIRARSHNANLHSYGVGDFTVEMWLYPETFANYISIYCQSNSAANATGFHIGLNASGQIFIYSSSAFQVTSNNSLTLNDWNHVAVVRYENIVTIYINGTASTNTWNLTTQTFTDAACVIGVSPALTTEFYRGYLHEFRASKIARYLQNFTPTTTKLPQVANTSLVEYVVVGGGASGAHTNSFRGVGGGGAGGVLTGYIDLELNQAATLTVGAGGASSVYASDTQDGNDGVTSSIAITGQDPIRAFGGGHGNANQYQTKTAPDGYAYSSGAYGPTSFGASTGGGAFQIGPGIGTVYQGHKGGAHATYADGGGGGGAGGGGIDAIGSYRIYQNDDTTLPNSRGGNSTTLFGVELAGGGGGGSGVYFSGNPNGGNGGFGGGGNGTNIGGKGAGDFVAPYGSAIGYTGFGDGATNTGSGGGAGGRNGASAIGPKGSGSGGSGIIMLKIPQTAYFSEIDPGLTYTIDRTTYAGYNIYKFTAGTGNVKLAKYLTVTTSYLITGGGGGGGRERGGGGGAGAYYTGTAELKLEYPYSVTIGAGGSGSTARTSAGSPGNDTTFSALPYPVIGGGGGGSNNTTVVAAKQGSSGGGGAGATAPNAVGTGALVTSTNIFIGTPGGNGGTGSGGGGGGTFSAGTAASGTTAGTGGAGITSTITGNSVIYAAGGGGGSNAGTVGAGGSSNIGGAGSNSDIAPGRNGTTNTGSGGGGGGLTTSGTGAVGGNGAGGILVLSYSDQYDITSNSLTISSQSISGNKRVSSIIDGTGTFKLTTRLATAFEVTYLIVAGGGGGGAGSNGGFGGGGAGGYRTANTTIFTGTNYTLTIGAGGSGGSSYSSYIQSARGNNSVFNDILSTGGGGGAGGAAGGFYGGDDGNIHSNSTGGSGGGGGGSLTVISPGASGNTPAIASIQGNSGGSGHANSPNYAGGGGGGAGLIGNSGFGSSSPGGKGGDGLINTILNSQPSTTSNTISSTGSKTFTIATNLVYATDEPIRVSNSSTNWMDGLISTYNSSTGAITVTINASNGSGTFTSWTIHRIYAGGGGGGSHNRPSAGIGGAGGGGGGGQGGSGYSGSPNTGGGGGGSGVNNVFDLITGGNGGSGIVILRYANTKTITVGPGLTYTTRSIGTDTAAIFTAGTGTISFS
jgi:hypothetical protein